MKKTQQIGIIKRRAKRAAKGLVEYYLENGIHENYGHNEMGALCSDVNRLRLQYTDESRLKEDIRDLINGVNDNLFANGRGNTRNQKTKSLLADNALYDIKAHRWSTLRNWTFYQTEEYK